MIKKICKQAYQILIFQLAIVLLLAIVVLFFKQELWCGLSILLGGLAYLIPSLLLIAKFFSAFAIYKHKNSKGEKLLIAFYSGELLKLIFSFILLLLLFHFIPVKIIFVLTGYGAASLSLLFLPAVPCIDRSMDRYR
jgi:F0F1-type ATP synthase assembly protein I